MQSFVAQPPCVAPARSSAVSMSLLQQPMDRRAAVSGAGLALFAMGQRANGETGTASCPQAHQSGHSQPASQRLCASSS